MQPKKMTAQKKTYTLLLTKPFCKTSRKTGALMDGTAPPTVKALLSFKISPIASAYNPGYDDFCLLFPTNRQCQ